MHCTSDSFLQPAKAWLMICISKGLVREGNPPYLPALNNNLQQSWTTHSSAESLLETQVSRIFSAYLAAALGDACCSCPAHHQHKKHFVIGYIRLSFTLWMGPMGTDFPCLTWPRGGQTCLVAQYSVIPWINFLDHVVVRQSSKCWRRV